MGALDRRDCNPGASDAEGCRDTCLQDGGNGRGPVYDARYRALVGADAWRALPDAVRLRFSKKIPVGGELVYRGHIARARVSFLGGILVQALRLIGGPLPLSRRAGTRVVVTVREAVSGQVWTRRYDRHGRKRPQVIRSLKRFGGPTGLEERVGWGVGMRLVAEGLVDGLSFRSQGYFWAPFGGRGIAIPGWLTPGQLTVVHREVDCTVFDFELELVHPVFGLLVGHCARFKDPE